MSLSRYALIVLLSLIPLFNCHAQSSNGTVKFSCLSWSKLPYEKVFYAEGNKMLPLEVTVGRRSEPVEIKTEKSLRLYTPVIDPEGKQSYKQIAQAPLLANSKRMLFVVSGAPKDSPFPVALYGLDDSLTSFPMGSFRFLNFTPVPLEISFNGKTDRIKPKAVSLIKSRVGTGGGFLVFTVKLPNGQKIFETRLYSQERGREMVFISPPPKGRGNLKIRFLPQTIPPPKQAVAQ